MNTPRAPKRRAAGIAGAKALITSASLAATLGGWAAIGAASDPSTGMAASLPGAAPQNDAAPADGQGAVGQQQDGMTPFSQGPFTRRRRHWQPAPNRGGFGDQPATPGLPGSGDNQSPGQAAPQTPGTSGVSPAPAPIQPRARTRSSR